jgi:hypothetical protein
MASGNRKTLFGTFEGDGSADVEIKTLPFRPSAVELLNLDGLASATWVEGMADATCVKEVTAGTKSAVASPNGITPLSTGFKLGQDGDLNVAGEKVFWKAYE